MSAVYAHINDKRHNPWVSRNKRRKHDEYKTPQSLIAYAVRQFVPRSARKILDVGANDGRWGIIAANHVHAVDVLCGVEIQDMPKPLGFTHWHGYTDYTLPMDRAMMDVTEFDLIVANPPFKPAEAIVRAAWHQLAPGGTMIMLLPITFCGSDDRRRGLWLDLPPYRVHLLTPRVQYEYPGNKDNNPRDDGLYIWRKHEGGDVDGRAGLLPVEPVRWK